MRKRILFSGLVLLGFFVVLEVAARLFWTPGGPDGATPLDAHPTRGWALQDKASSAGVQFELGEHGLRRVPLTGAPHRILTTGDSSIFGHGLRDADTLHLQLSGALREKGLSVDVMTAGVPGYTSTQTLDQMERFGWQMDLDVLLIGNLWSDSDFEASPDPNWAEHESRSEPGVLMRNSRALQLLDSVFGPGPEAIDWATPLDLDGERRVAVEDYVRNLEVLIQGARQRGILPLMLLPCNRELAASIPTPPKGWPWTPYFEAALGVLEAHQVPSVSGCEVAKSKGLQGNAAFLDEMHPTAALNQAYAQALAAKLVAIGWPDRVPQ